VSVILILIVASLGVAAAFLVAFVWAVRAGQFEDTCTPAMRILSEDEASRQGAVEAKGQQGAGALKK
jgi:cbb3-type cytochrome oxidase maturation protein